MISVSIFFRLVFLCLYVWVIVSPTKIAKARICVPGACINRSVIPSSSLFHGEEVTPVYRGGYLRSCCYSRSQDRQVVRITDQTDTLLDSNGTPCLGKSFTPNILMEGIEQFLLWMNITVIYKKTGKTVTRLDDFIILEQVREQEYFAIIYMDYNVTLTRKSNCTRIRRELDSTLSWTRSKKNRDHLFTVGGALLLLVFVYLLAFFVFYYFFYETFIACSEKVMAWINATIRKKEKTDAVLV